MKGNILEKIFYPHVDAIVCFHSAEGPQGVLYILHLTGRRKDTSYYSIMLN